MQRLALGSVLLLALAASGCAASKDKASTAAASAAPINATCPIMGGSGVDTGVTVVYEGKTIAFCCDGCIAEWNALSDAERTERVAKMTR
jgi:hypothetical protein